VVSDSEHAPAHGPRPAPLPHVRRQAAQWAWWLLLVLVLIFGTAQRLAHVADQRRASADEGTYAQFTGRVAQLGLPASPWDRLSAMMGPRTKRVLVALLGVRVVLGGGDRPQPLHPLHREPGRARLDAALALRSGRRVVNLPPPAAFD